MGNWLSAEPGLSPVDTVQIPSGQRDDNRRGGEEAVEKGRNRAAVEGYIGAQRGASKWKNNFRRTHVPVATVTEGYMFNGNRKFAPFHIVACKKIFMVGPKGGHRTVPPLKYATELDICFTRYLRDSCI